MDIAGQKREELRLRLQKLATFVSLDTGISATADLSSVLKLIGLTARQATGAESTALLLLDPGTRELYFEVAEGERGQQVRQIRVPMGKGIAGWVAERNQPLIVNDPYHDPRFFSDADKRTGFKTRNLICVPLQLRRPGTAQMDQIVGVLEVLNKRDGTPFTADDQMILDIVASKAAIAIDNVRTMKSLRDAMSKLQAAQENL